jgi:RNA polymerase sigma factor (sigma-70 family)
MYPGLEWTRRNFPAPKRLESSRKDLVEASTLQAPVAMGRRSVSVPLLRVRSDEQLVAMFRAGSDDAFRAIHDRYRARLLTYARQMLGGSRHDAEDALQDVFVRAYASLRASERPVSLRAWLYRVAHNRCIDQLRRPVPAVADVFEVSRTPARDPSLETERRDELRRLVVDVGRLPDQQRSALLMRELQGMTYEDLAQALGVSVAAVKSLLVRARGGLVDSATARDTACVAIRSDLALACDRGVRTSGLARRHLRDCAGCRAYKDELRGVQRQLGALVPVGTLGFLSQAVGLGGAGAAAGGAAGVGGAAGLGGLGALATATKVALVCAAAAVTAGGALEVVHHAPLAPAHRAPVTTVAAAPSIPRALATAPASSRATSKASKSARATATVTRHAGRHAGASPAVAGGVQAPADMSTTTTATAYAASELPGGEYQNLLDAPGMQTSASGGTGASSTTPAIVAASVTSAVNGGSQDATTSTTAGGAQVISLTPPATSASGASPASSTAAGSGASASQEITTGSPASSAPATATIDSSPSTTVGAAGSGPTGGTVAPSDGPPATDSGSAAPSTADDGSSTPSADSTPAAASADAGGRGL